MGLDFERILDKKTSFAFYGMFQPIESTSIVNMPHQAQHLGCKVEALFTIHFVCLDQIDFGYAKRPKPCFKKKDYFSFTYPPCKRMSFQN